MSSIFSYHKGKKTREKPKHVESEQHATKRNNGSIEKSKNKSKNILRQEKKNTTFQNLWEITKAVLRRKFTVIQAYLKKQEKSQINNLIYHLKELEKEEQTKSKVSRKKEIIKIREEINKIKI